MSRWWKPLVGSLAVYLIPLVGPHAVWPVGVTLARAYGSDPWWFAANVALALAAQAAVGLLLAWTLSGPGLRWVVWLAAAPVLVVGFNVAYQIEIPSYFLIERDTLPERAEWREHCFVPDVTLAAIRSPVTQPSSGVGQWWTQDRSGRHALLRVPDCVLEAAGLPTPTVHADGRADFILRFEFAAFDGTVLVERLVPGTPERTWWLLALPSAPLIPLAGPDDAKGAPILSNAGDAVAWVEPVGGSGSPTPGRVRIRPVQSSASFTGHQIELAQFGPASYTLHGVATATRQIVLWQNDHPLIVDFDGQPRPLFFAPGPVRPHGSTFLLHQDGWLAWDGYQDLEPYRMQWSLRQGAGQRRTNKGRGITAGAIDPTGGLIAVSETTQLNIGRAPDVVYVFRASDGSDVFRTYLPRHARSQVVFFADGFFGYSDLTGTHILRVPH